MEPAGQFLNTVLHRVRDIDANELWLLSGVGALAKAKGMICPVHAEQLSPEDVFAMHKECLAIAGRTDLDRFPHVYYAVEFSTAGTFLCEYVQRRNTNNLRLLREAETHMAGPFSRPKLPALAAEATPNPSIERTCPGKPGHAAHVER
jgi:Tfp pilus assembly ATPase PilU